MNRRATLSLLLVAMLLVLPLVALWTLGHSEAALRFAVARLPQQFGTIERFEIREVSGTLAGGFTVGAIEIDHDVVHVRLHDVRARIDLLPLLWQAVEARELRVERVDIVPQPRDKPPPDRPVRFLPALLTVEARELRIPLIEISPREGLPIVFSDTTIDTVIRSRTIGLRALRSRLGNIALDADGRLLAGNPLGLEVDVRAGYQPKRGPRWRIQGNIDGDLADANVDATLVEPFDVKLEDATLRSLLPWKLSGNATVANLDLRKFGGSDFLGLIGGTLALEIDREGYRARGALTPPGLKAGALEVDFDGRYSQGVVTVRKFALRHAASLSRVELSGTVTATEAGPLLDLDGAWQPLRWPLDDLTPPLTSTRGTFTLQGTGPYDLTAAGDARIGALPVVDATLEAQLQPGRLQLSRIVARALGGEGIFGGEVAWRPSQRWQITGPVRGIDPGNIRAALPGRVDFELDVAGRGFGAAGSIDIAVRDLRGRLRGTSAQGSGRLAISGDTLKFEKVNLAAGGLRLALDGTTSPRRNDFDFRIDANDLGVLVAGGEGRLNASGTLRGTANSMLVRLAAQGRDLVLGDLVIGTLTADVDLDPLGGADASASARIDASKVEVVGRKADRVRLDIAGRAAAHTLAIEVSGPDLAVNARGDGSFDPQGWRQRWPVFDLRLPEENTLALEQPLVLQLTADSIDVPAFCLRGARDSSLTSAATFCGSGAVRQDGWNTDVTIARLPLASILPRPVARARYEGSVNAALQLRSATRGLPRGSLRADIEGARLRWQRAGGKEDLIPLGSGTLSLDSTESGLRGSLDIAAGERGRANGEITALPAIDENASWHDMPLTATLRADSSALALLYLYVPEIDRSAGDLSLDLSVGGMLGAPLVNGVLRLENGELDFYQVNLALRDIRAEARLIDNGFSLKSSALAGRGRIEADAQLEWRKGQPFGELRIKGENLTVIDVPEARIDASPDLRFRVAGRDLLASGNVLIPRARIVPADLTGAVLASADEIRVDADPPDPQSTFRVTSNLRLTLGDQVTLDSFGLSGRLAGTLNVTTSPDGSSRGSGELGVAEGKYAALGRRLDIERGRLIFSGGLIGDPGVDLRATKIFPDVRAGVNVRGTLREPRMSFFSEPSLPQSQVVSLILAGGTLESAQNSTLSNSGRDAILAQGGAILAQQLGQRIGIEDVGIEQNLANETSLVFGKYLSSRLYVSYGVSLAESINTLKLRYSINDRWTLRTEAGKEASGEIVYTVEKN